MTDELHGLTVGSTARFEKQITRRDIDAFADATGDHQPLHSDPGFAARTRFRHPIAHGILGAGVISAALGTQLAPGLVVIYMAQNLQFRAPVSENDTLIATVTVTKVDVPRSRLSLDTLVTNQDGTEVIRGDALVMVEAPN